MSALRKNAMNPNLDHLVMLQAVDLETKHLRADLAEAPRRVERAAAELAKVEAALKAVGDALRQKEALLRRQESDADDHRNKLTRLRKQMDSATSTAQVTALEHEINFAEDAITRLENEELLSLERTEQHELEQVRSQAALEKAQVALEKERKRAAEVEADVSQQIAARERERAALREQIDEMALRTYDRVAKVRGTGVAEGIDHKCSACQMMVRPQRWNELTSREANSEIFTCETCGRMLFWDPRRDAPGAWPAGERLNKATALEART